MSQKQTSAQNSTLPAPPRPCPGPAGKLRIIAEPGRYFAEATGTYFCHVNGWRQRALEGEALPAMDYYLSDGLYGSMNCLVRGRARRGGAAAGAALLICVRTHSCCAERGVLGGREGTCKGRQGAAVCSGREREENVL